MIRRTLSFCILALVTLTFGAKDTLTDVKTKIETIPVGMLVRVRQHSMDEILHALQFFLPHWLVYDLDLKGDVQEYHWSTLFGLLQFKL